MAGHLALTLPNKRNSSMIILVDNRIPDEAKSELANYGVIILFSTEGITYPTISCHPDIFFCKMNDKLIVAPNVPDKYKNILAKKAISFVEGESPVGDKYPETAKYNALCTEKYLIHNFRYTDFVISDIAGDIELIHSGQGYTRCNLLALKNDHFITSDGGISRVLNGYNLKNLFVEPNDILLPGMKHGFFGGACGVHENKVFIIGSLRKFKEGEKVRDFLQSLEYAVVELYDGPLFDGGSILFL
jgi:hypothetical protein